MDIISVYKDVQDKVKQEQNGELTIEEFNRNSKLAELRLLDWLSGDVAGVAPPEPYTTLKDLDWLSIFIVPGTYNVQDGKLEKPADYYLFEAHAVIGSRKDELCGEVVTITGIDTPIELLTAAAFLERSQTYIKRLQPSIRKPICKMVGKNFEYLPKDLGSVKLEYKRYPVFGKIGVKKDEVYNEEVPDPATSTNYEWPEFGRGLLVWWIAEMYSTSTREDSLLQHLQAEGKTARG